MSERVKVVAIIGSRQFPEDRSHLITDRIDQIEEGTVIVSGGAKGPDTWSSDYARSKLWPVVDYPVATHAAGMSIDQKDWARFFYARNEALARVAHGCIAFVTSMSGGTWDAIRRFEALGKPVEVWFDDGTHERR